MLKELLELKNSGAVAIKIEFESEFYDEKTASELSDLVHNANLDLCIKLGGASSIQDLHLCKKLKANSIVAPMVESAYAVQKFLNCINQVFEKKHPELLINIETKNGFDNLENIIDSCQDKISGFVIGRSDLKNSLSIENPNDDKILQYCKKLSKICKKTNKKLIIGGKIDSHSLEFVDKIPYLNMVETRKIIFKRASLNEGNLLKALEFELKYFEAKKNIFEEDLARIQFIKNSLSNKLLV